MGTKHYGEPGTDQVVGDKRTPVVERLRALCARDGVSYPAAATVEELQALLYAVPKHAKE